MEIQKLALGFGSGGVQPQGQRTGSFSVEISASNPQMVRALGSAEAKKEEPVTEQAAKQATQKLQADMSGLHGNIQFSVDAATGKTLVKVVDAKTKDVLMQLPSKTALAIAQMLDEGQKTSLINDKA